MVEQIERELLLPAGADEVWQIVTSSGWLAEEVHLELFPGGEASFDSEGCSKHGWVEEAVAPRPDEQSAGRLTFWWGTDDEPATRVELTLEPGGAQATRLRVVEARPLELLDVIGIPLAEGEAGGRGPAMLVAA